MKNIIRLSLTVPALFIYIAGAVIFSNCMSGSSSGGSTGKEAPVTFEKGVVISVDLQTVSPDSEHSGLFQGFQDITVRILSGGRTGTNLQIRNYLNPQSNYLLRPGNGIILRLDFSNNKFLNVNVFSIDRGPALYLLAFIFVILLCIAGGWRGFRSLLGIAFTFTGVIFIFIPMIYRGFSPAMAAVLITSLAALGSFILLDGLNAKTISAILGTISGLAVSAVLALVFQDLTMVSGSTSAEADSLLSVTGLTGMKTGELFFASVLIASLGAVMDIAISVSSAISEVRSTNPGISRTGLFASGMNVGIDMMGTMANTLILAFTGASLTTLILIYSIEHSYTQILNSNFIVMEAIEALTGSIAVIVTVPAVAFIASRQPGRRYNN